MKLLSLDSVDSAQVQSVEGKSFVGLSLHNGFIDPYERFFATVGYWHQLRQT